MSGWLIKTHSPGLNPGVRAIEEIWAAWIDDAVDAVIAVEKRSGVGDPPAETLRDLSEELLRGLGLTEKGQVVRVRAEF